MVESADEVVIRRATADDLAAIQRALYLAATWDSPSGVPPLAVAVQHPELARYHRGWGRAGDIGAVAVIDDEVVGAAFARRFTEADHGHGYLDEVTPEIAIGVEPAMRGRGIGARLMEATHELARADGRDRISLSVDADNPSKRLYDRLGYVVVDQDEGGFRMVRSLDSSY